MWFQITAEGPHPEARQQFADQIAGAEDFPAALAQLCLDRIDSLPADRDLRVSIYGNAEWSEAEPDTRIEISLTLTVL